MEFPGKILIFMGMFGSGKTEIALNFAQSLSKAGQRVALADIDTISPYYRSRDLREAFGKDGIKIIAPAGKLAHADLPIISPEIFGYVENPEYRIVIDVGGNDDGAVVLSSLIRRLPAERCTTFYVLNPYRPFNDTIANAVSHVERLREKSRMRIDFLVNNSNIGPETTGKEILHGEDFIEEISKITTIPVAFTVVMNGVKALKGRYHEFRIVKYMKNPWEVENE